MIIVIQCIKAVALMFKVLNNHGQCIHCLLLSFSIMKQNHYYISFPIGF